ncbi:hypothetical protein Afe04nite_27610 [Asanoa ferruginea]|uniref:hypothetical protein n=1 Tax=Asanoa ferruginea TaxID=53367 RepID=UPI0011C15007|nr:hypothetical protein [Asanoa ferruginea]GIF48222.1 hypothetical protein Afe04nite_27610 [Asanoa ferruginea]
MTGSITATVVKMRAYLLAFYLWQKTQDRKILREVAQFEQRIQGEGKHELAAALDAKVRRRNRTALAGPDVTGLDN